MPANKCSLMAPPKKRLDLLLVDRQLAASRQRARAMIMTGNVLVNDQPVDKTGTQVPTDARITIRGETNPYVSRGGLKLAGALDACGVDPADMVCMDVGASTGGFTDCLLQHRASRVYAVDVGYGQLAWSLRQDQRVINLERTNIRHLAPDSLPELMDLVTIDTSFISLRIVVPDVLPMTRSGGIILALIKPQFEVGRGKVGKGGVVRDGRQHRQVIDNLSTFFKNEGLHPICVAPSPILGPKGNREFFIRLNIP